MRPIPFSLTLFAVGLWVAPSCLAQHWELGGAAGYGATRNVAVSRDGQSAEADFKAGVAAGVFGAQDLYPHLSGELRYIFRFADPRLTSGGTKFVFDGRTHAVHYDFLFFAQNREAPARLFAAGGAGIRVYEGTGRETAVQPLSRFAVLTRTREVKPLISLGGGIRFKVAGRAFLRVEFRDYITPVPRDVITPARGARITGWFHDFVPMFGISAGF